MARTTKAAKATKATKKSTKKPAKSPAKSATKKPAKTSAKKSARKSVIPKKASAGTTAPKKRTTTAAAKSTKRTSKRTVSQSPPSKKKSPAKRASASTKTTSRAKKAKSPFDSRFLEQMRKLLHTERDVYERQAKQLRAEADSLVADMDPGDVQFDEESGEGDTIAVERGRDLALASKALEMIDEIDHALAKFDLGTYGVCEISGDPIPRERLEAIPWAREKVEYKVGGFGRR